MRRLLSLPDLHKTAAGGDALPLVELTPDPSDAHLYLVPAFGTNMFALLDYYMHAVAAIDAAHPFWARRGGADHVFLITSDRGGCHLRALPQLNRSLLLAHYLRFSHGASLPSSCGDPVRDVPFPPFLPADKVARVLAAGDAAPLRARPLSFFFAGKVPEAKELDARPDKRIITHSPYSEGARQMAWKHLRHLAPAYKVVMGSKTYADDFAQSKVCLAALGQGWGIRFIWSVGAGCVPLLPHSKLGVAYYFEQALNWTQFALPDVPLHVFPTLPDYIKRVGDAELAQKQASLRRHRRLFLWDPTHGGLAFEMTMRELCVRYRTTIADAEWEATHRRGGRVGAGGAGATRLLPDCARIIPHAHRFEALLPVGRPS